MLVQCPVHHQVSLPVSRRQCWTSCRLGGSKQIRSSRRAVVSYCSQNGKLAKLSTKVAIIGSGPAAHTAAVYTARAELKPVLFEGWMANGIAPGGQLTTTTYVENFPGFPEPILGADLCDNFRKQSARYGTKIFTETVNKVDFSERPFTLWTDTKVVSADTVIVATGAKAKRLPIPGADEVHGYWNKGISACAICDGSSPLFRNTRVGVVGGGDSAMEEAGFLSRYASEVVVIHRFDYLEASKAMTKRAMDNPKIKFLWHHEVVEAYGNEEGVLAGVIVRDNQKDTMKELPLSGLFFAIGHVPATSFLEGQLELDSMGYIKTTPGSTATSVEGVFAAGDVQDHKYRQAITAAGSGCMAALEAERYLQALESSGNGKAADCQFQDAPNTYVFL